MILKDGINSINDCINNIVCGDCIEVLKKLPDNCIDLTVTSPPYDNLRDYNGSWKIDLPLLGKELYRVTKDGGIIVMLMQDETSNFAKSVTTFKTIVDWVENANLRLFECNIFFRSGAPGRWWKTRFRVDHEYMPIFLKGNRPSYFNKEHLKLDAEYGDQANCWGAVHKIRKTDNELKEDPKFINPKKKCRGTVWNYTRDRSLENLRKGKKSKHPRTFPLQFPIDIIPTFTKEDAIILDPLCGSGTTCLAAKRLNRKYIGIDFSEEYCKLAEEILSEK